MVAKRPQVELLGRTHAEVFGAAGVTEDHILSHFYRQARLARIYDGPDEVHKMVLAKFMREEGRDFWSWSAGNRV